MHSATPQRRIIFYLCPVHLRYIYSYYPKNEKLLQEFINTKYVLIFSKRLSATCVIRSRNQPDIKFNVHKLSRQIFSSGGHTEGRNALQNSSKSTDILQKTNFLRDRGADITLISVISKQIYTRSIG